MNAVSAWIFWLSVAAIVFTYLGFPLLTWLRAVLWRRPLVTDSTAPTESIPPTVSVLIAAHNEEASIVDKVQNMLNLNYPSGRLQIVVASDGSEDRTVELLAPVNDPRLRVLDLARGGKAAALNAGVPHCTGEILVLSDANSLFGPDSLQALVAPFADHTVGGVAGDQRYLKASKQHTSAADSGERSYWNFDRRMKRWQTVSGNVTSATGAIYAIRRRLFATVPEGVTDDFATSTSVIAQGYRLVFAPEAAAYEPVAASSDVEFGRKVRIITRGLRGVLQMKMLLNPCRFGFYSLQLFCHKVLRRQMVFPLLALFLTSLWLAARMYESWLWPLYATAAVGQLVFYSAAVCGWLCRSTWLGRKKPLSLPFFFCMVNFACLVATVKSLKGERVLLWETQRAVEGDSSPQPVRLPAGES